MLEKRQVLVVASLDTLAETLGMEYCLESCAIRSATPGPAGSRRASIEGLGYWPLDDDGRGAGRTMGGRGRTSHACSARSSPRSPPSKPTAAVVVTAQSGTPVLSAGFDAAGDEIDDEIREIFLEEFQEEIANLDELLPAWRRGPDDLEQLRPIRRVPYAQGQRPPGRREDLGEFSWHVENMRNRVLDGSRSASPAVVAFVSQVRDVLPQLHAALRGEASLSVDLAAMEGVADRLGAGEEVLLDVAPTREPSVPSTEFRAALPGDAAGDTTTVRVDPVLLEILGTEVGGHLETIDAWLATARDGDAAVNDGLLRAIHTLNGAFAMTEVPSVTAFTAPAETYVKRFDPPRSPADGVGVAALGEMAEAIRASTHRIAGNT